MAFISSSKNSSGNEEDNTAGVPTASTQVSTAGATVSPARSAGLPGVKTGEGETTTDKGLRVGWDWSFMANEEENHALVADEEAPTEFALMAKTSADSEVCHRIEYLTKELENLKNEKEGLKSKLTVLSPPPPAQVYSPPKKDMSWTGLPEFDDDIIIDYTMPSPSVESNPNDLQNSSSSASENGE
nr:hypothetical protein [Tanacetum cinerariifolium]